MKPASIRIEAQGAYEKGGKQAVFDLNALKWKFPYKMCNQCEDETPHMKDECLVCGSVTDREPVFGLKTYTVEELFDIDREECDEQVIKVADLTSEQKLLLGLRKTLNVIVEVSGGLVTNIYASKGLGTKIQFDVLDYDNMKDAKHDPDHKDEYRNYKKLEREIKSLQNVW